MPLILIFNSHMSQVKKKHRLFRSLCFSVYWEVRKHCHVKGTIHVKGTVHVKPTIKIICIIYRHIQSIPSDLLYFAKLYVSVEYVLVKATFEIIASNWDNGFWRAHPKKIIGNRMKKVKFSPAILFLKVTSATKW